MRFRKGFRLWWLLIPILLADQFTKHLARQLTRVQTAIPGVLSWAHTVNRGAAFSMLTGAGILLILLTAALIIALWIVQLRRSDNSAPERIGLWCVIGGGLGNLIDRIILGGVTDFIRLDFINFAIFNVADIFVCCGAALVALAALMQENGRKQHG